MLIDYLEDASEELKKDILKYQKLGRKYHRIHQKDIREEMERVKKEIKKKRSEIRSRILENLDEFKCVKKYYPELFQMYLDDEALGKVIKKTEWLAEVKPMEFEKAAKSLGEIKEKREQLRDAKEFLGKWVGKVNARSFGATYPVLKEHLEGKMEKRDVIEKIKKLQKKLKKDGWKVIVSSPQLLGMVLERFMEKLKFRQILAREKEALYEQAIGKGSVAEFRAKREFERAERKLRKTKKSIRQLLQSNPGLLRALKKMNIRTKKRTELELFAENVTSKKVNEKEWLKEIRKRIEESG